MKICLLQILLFVSISTCLSAQTADNVVLTKAESSAFIDNMVRMAQQTKSLRCNFVQQKYVSVLTDVAESSGVMEYGVPSSLRWEYKKPEAFAFVLNNGKASITNAQGEVNMPAQAKKMIASLSDLILSMINGSILTDGKSFDSEYRQEKGDVIVRLLPKVARIKKSFLSITIRVDGSLFVAKSVEMLEKSGDKTVIVFSNIKVDTIHN